MDLTRALDLVLQPEPENNVEPSLYREALETIIANVEQLTERVYFVMDPHPTEVWRTVYEGSEPACELGDHRYILPGNQRQQFEFQEEQLVLVNGDLICFSLLGSVADTIAAASVFKHNGVPGFMVQMSGVKPAAHKLSVLSLHLAQGENFRVYFVTQGRHSSETRIPLFEVTEVDEEKCTVTIKVDKGISIELPVPETDSGSV